MVNNLDLARAHGATVRTIAGGAMGIIQFFPEQLDSFVAAIAERPKQPETDPDGHSCSYFCARPACIKARESARKDSKAAPTKQELDEPF